MNIRPVRRFAALALCAAIVLLAPGCSIRRAVAQNGGLRQRLRDRVAQRTEGSQSETKKDHIDLEIAGLKVSVWKPAQPGPAPLVIFSHGFTGSSTQSMFLMKALAEHGYL